MREDLPTNGKVLFLKRRSQEIHFSFKKQVHKTQPEEKTADCKYLEHGIRQLCALQPYSNHICAG